jgi:hypothetical protein
MWTQFDQSEADSRSLNLDRVTQVGDIFKAQIHQSGG